VKPAQHSHPRRGLVAVALAAGAVLAAGCAAPKPQAPLPVAAEYPKIENGVQVFTVVGLSDLRFSVATLVAKPGTIRVDFSVEPGSASHDFDIPKIPAAHTDIIGAGTSQSVTFTVTQPGAYPVICTLHPNMNATLQVS
jgi:plastocyanin